jgi:hypothetical protein
MNINVTSNIKNYTQSNENSIFQGKRNVTDFLPFILQTTTNKKFFESTLDQLLSSGSTIYFDTYWGKISGSNYNYNQDLFNPEYNNIRQNYQFAPGVFVDNNTLGDKSISYINLINKLSELGYNTGNLDSLFTSDGYTLDLPIDLDMFINYTNYYWLPMDIPVCEIDATEENPINFDDIEKLNTYTTPILSNGKTLTFYNSIRVKFIGDNITGVSDNFELDAVYMVEGVGSGNIKLIKQYDSNKKNLFPKVAPYTPKIPSEWDVETWQEIEYDVSKFINIEKEYVVMERTTIDKNTWARINQWHSFYAIEETSKYLNIPFERIRNEAFKGRRPIIQFKENIELFDSGKILKYIINHHIDGNVNPNTILNKEYYNNNGFPFEDNEIVLFTNNSNSNYNNRIFTIGGIGDSITLTLLSSTFDDYDKCLLLHSNKKEFINNELYWIDQNWRKGQQKQFRGSSALFNLYDTDTELLSNYSESTFFGNEIFSYFTSDTTPIDRETNLKIKPDNNSSDDFIFNIDINDKRYFKNNITKNIVEIKGDYFYKNLKDQLLYSIWNPLFSKQRVLSTKTFVSQEVTTNLNIKTDTTPEIVTKYIFANNEKLKIYSLGNDGVYTTGKSNENIFFMKNTEYTITLLSEDAITLDFFDPFGNAPSGITIITNDDIKVTISDNYEYDFVEYYVDNDKKGKIFIVDKSSGYNVYKNGLKLQEVIDYVVSQNNIILNENTEIGDIFEIRYVSNESNDSRDIAPIIKYNPQNSILKTLNFSNMYNHISDIFENSPYFIGANNGFNNYHISPKIHNYGGIIRQQVYSPISHTVFSNYSETEPLNAITQLAIDYAIFKNYFKSKVKQLWDTYNFENIHELVDLALKEMNFGKNSDFKYAKSDMIYYDETVTFNYDYDGLNNTFDIGVTLDNYNGKNTHIYVWGYELYGSIPQWKQLIKNRDYIIQSNKVIIIRNLNIDETFTAKIKIKIYDRQNFNSYVPFSPAKLGFTQPTEVSLTDGYLNCHDGSRYKVTGDIFYVNSPSFDIYGAALYDFESRIYNNLIEDNFKTIDIRSFISQKNVHYDIKTIDQLLEKEFNYWTVDFNYFDQSVDENFNLSNKFSLNYSTVSDYNSWKQLYKNIFNTERPHTHPWEILGYYYRPIWWNTWYSWTDNTKRQRLIKSIKNGIVSEPVGNVIIDPNYAIPDYDWDNNVLVDTNGILNNPVDAGLVLIPNSIDAAKRFEFGDGINPEENGWKNSSEYLFSLVKVLLKLNPFETFETYWKLNEIIQIQNSFFAYDYKTFKDILTRNNKRNKDLHNHIKFGEIEKVEILNGGKDYTTVTVISDFNKEGTAEFEPFIRNGSIESIRILNPGFNYKEDVKILFIDGDGINADAKGLVSTQRYKTVLGLNAVIVENISSVEKTNIVSDLLETILISPICHLSGYTSKEKIEIILEGSYKKGQLFVPKEDYFVFLSKNPALKTQFYSGIRLVKEQNKISVYGYNNNEKLFPYYAPRKNSASIVQNILNYQLLKYKDYNNTLNYLKYGYSFDKRQDLYDFILGLGHYYKLSGFENIDWENSANEALLWVLSNDNDDFYINGVVNNELIFNYGDRGYLDQFNEQDIVDNNFNFIKFNNINVIRNESNVVIKAREDNIYGISIKVSEFEHVLVINNKSKFGDIISDNITGLYQSRIRIRGEKTRDWNGKLEANGYIITKDGVFNNFDSNVREMERDINNTNAKFFNTMTKKTNRFSVGYQEPLYLTGTFIDENNAYMYTIGERKYQGTRLSIDSFMRNKNLFGLDIKSHSILEEWMIRLGDYGDKRKSDPIQVELNQGLIKTNPQTIRFNSEQRFDRLDDQVIDISKNDKNYISGNFDTPVEMLPIQKFGPKSIKETKVFENFYKNAGLPLLNEAEYKFKSIDDIDIAYDIFADYANIPDWKSTIPYNKGDIVRKDGKVYELEIDNSGLNLFNDSTVLNGNIIFPKVPSGSTFIITTKENEETNEIIYTITFQKTAQVSQFNPINVSGTIDNPIVNAGDTLIIDNSTITFVNPTPNILVFNPTLDIDQIVLQINSANIPNVTARVKLIFLANVVSGRVVEIISTNQRLFIGQGNANTKIGLTSGLTNASSSIQSAPVELSLFEVVQRINNELIPGVSAIILNDRLQLQFSNNLIYNIGNGTANQFLGITNNILVTQPDIIENIFNENQWIKIDDPTNISVWVYDNIGTKFENISRNKGYNVYRTFDFEFNIQEICIGILEGDNALVKVDKPHNLNVNDLIIIINSTSIPSIDGIHQITRINSNESFFIDKFIEQDGFSGKLLKLNPVRFPTSEDLFDSKNDPSYSLGGLGWKPGMIAYVDSIIENDISTGIGGVYQCVQNIFSEDGSNVSFELIRKQNQKTNNFSIQNAKTFIEKNYQNLSILETYDPYKGIIPGIIDKEIDLKTDYDVAMYNSTTDVDNFYIDENNYWGENEIGTRWWDLSNAIYIDYEQDTLEYRQSNWGKLFPTSTIDVYEWIKSPVPPDEYINATQSQTIVNGVELTGEPYTTTDKFGDTVYYWSEETKLNKDSSVEETYYYFWVKNKTTLPNRFKNYSVLQLKNIIEAPSDNGISWIAASSENSVLISDLSKCVSCDNTVLQINFKNSDIENHKEYILINEKSYIPEFLHNSIRDSLACFDKNEHELIYDIWDEISIYERGDVIYFENKYYVANRTNQNVKPNINTLNVWSELIDITKIDETNNWEIDEFSFSWDSGVWDKKVWDRVLEPTQLLPFVIVDELQNFGACKRLVQVRKDNTDKYIGSKISVKAPNRVPNQRLHPLNRYGLSIKPRQGIIKNIKNARREFVNKINSELAKINIVDNISGWEKIFSKIIKYGNIDYDLRTTWRYVDWKASEYNSNIKEKYILQTITELNDLVPNLMDYARIKKSDNKDRLNREMVYVFNGMEWKLIFKEKATIQFLDSLWNTKEDAWGWDDFIWDSNDWDIHFGYLISYIFDILRNEIFIASKRYIYNDIWFSTFNYIFSESDDIDWAIKTSYIKVEIEKELKQIKKYVVNKDDLLIDYINKNKPFKTKIRDFIDRNTGFDNADIKATEISRINNLYNQYNRYDGYNWIGENLLKGGDHWEIQPFVDKLDIDDEPDFIYDGNSFYHPQYKGFGEELLSMSMQDTAIITVIRNTNSDIEDANTKRFIILKNNREKLEASLITDEYMTVLYDDISKTDKAIKVEDLHPENVDSGAIWIGREKINYKNYNEYPSYITLYNCTRSVGKTYNDEYTQGETVMYDNKINVIFDTINKDGNNIVVVKI